MNWILAKLLGIDPLKLKDVPLKRLQLRFLGLPESWLALLCIALVAMFVWLSFRTYRREGKHASPRLKNFLACLRLAWLACSPGAPLASISRTSGDRFLVGGIVLSFS